MYRKLLSLAQQGEIPWSIQFIESIENDYPGLYDYYMRYYYDMPAGIPLGDPQHQMMAQHYKDIIVDALSQFDNNQHPQSLYEAIAWTGLMGNGPIDPITGLSSNPTVAWQNLSQQKRLNILNTIDNFNNTNSNCQ